MNEPDPIQSVHLEPSLQEPLTVLVHIDLAGHVAACCVNAQEAFVEFYGPAGRARAEFEFQEGRPAHRFIASVTLPAPGLYRYRIFAKVLGRALSREGEWLAPPETPLAKK